MDPKFLGITCKLAPITHLPKFIPHKNPVPNKQSELN